MKLLHRMTLRMLPGPFFGCLGTLMFLLLMQFLMRYLPDLVGKGLPFGVIVELIVYNLAYMVVLAVPMAMLIATIMAGGRLAESQAYTVIKNAGISFLRLSWPVYVVGLLLMAGMLYFNNFILPEANFRARSVWMDIRRTRPTVELEEGRFYTGLQGYSIRASRVESESGDLSDVVIFDHRERQPAPATITARRGTLETREGGDRLVLALSDGELHRYQREGARDPQYERLQFERYLLRFDISNLTFERRGLTSGSRSERTMRTRQMIHYVDSLQNAAGGRVDEARRAMRSVGIPDSDTASTGTSPSGSETPGRGSEIDVLAGLSPDLVQRASGRALEEARTVRSTVESASNNAGWYLRRADRYLVEIHKKFSIAVACVIFALIGAPLGVAIGRGSIGVASGLSATVFLFYWVTLVQGEKLADRGLLEPWIGMWAANVVVGLAGVVLTVAVMRDRTGQGAFQRLARMYRRWTDS